jgi:hypothetical protein
MIRDATHTPAPVMSSRWSCHISKLSNEILAVVFSFIRMDEIVDWAGGLTNYPGFPVGGHRKRMLQAFVLMRVSRQFRTVILDSPYWLDFEFDFSTLIDRSRYGYPNFEGPYGAMVYVMRLNRLLHVLLADQDFARALALKTDWIFDSTPEILWAILGCIPTFASTAQRLWLSLPRDHTYSFFPRLSMCQNVVELAIRHQDTLPLNLTAIADAFPQVQYLYLGLSWATDGSIRSLKKLISLELAVIIDRDEIVYLGEQHVPFASSKTLEVLKVGYRCAILPDEFDLRRFINLRHLQLPPDLEENDVIQFGDGDGYVDNVMDRILDSVSTKLESFETVFPRWFTASDIFAKPSLSDLRKIELTLETPPRSPSFWLLPPYDTEYSIDMLQPHVVHSRNIDEAVATHIVFSMKIVEGVTTDLISLREIVLINFGMDLEGLAPLVRLQRLEALTWVVPNRFSIRGNSFRQPTPETEEAQNEAEDFVWQHAEGALANVFVDFASRPKMSLKYSESSNNKFSRKDWTVANSRWPLRSVDMYDYEYFR